MRVVCHGYEGPRMTAQTAIDATSRVIAIALTRGDASWFMALAQHLESDLRHAGDGQGL